MLTALHVPFMVGGTAVDVGKSATPFIKNFAAERIDIAKEALQVGE